jgi:hypothetical protein
MERALKQELRSLLQGPGGGIRVEGRGVLGANLQIMEVTLPWCGQQLKWQVRQRCGRDARRGGRRPWRAIGNGHAWP